MGISFFENMSGTLISEKGTKHFIEFEVHVEATHLGVFLRTGVLSLNGILRAHPWADEAPIKGTLELSFLRKRTLEYRIEFTNEEEVNFRLFGKKTISALSPLLGMTDLSIELSSDDKTIAKGKMKFNLNDLLSFASSFSTIHSFGRVDLKGAQKRPRLDSNSLPDVGLLDAKEKALLLALGGIIIEPNAIIESVNIDTIDKAEEILRHLPPHIQKIYRVGLTTLNAASFARYLKPFSKLDKDQGHKLVGRLQDLVLALGAPIKTAHFSKSSYLKKVGILGYENKAKAEKQRWKTQIVKPEDLDESSTIPCDVIIVGSGAGGGPLAARLAEKGFAVALVEAGDYFDRSEFSGSPEKRLMRFSRDGGLNITLGNSSIVVPTGKMLGGTTTINSGTCFDTPHSVLNEWRDKGFPEEFQPDSFSPWLKKVHEELQIEKAKPPWLGEIANRVAHGAEYFRDRFPDLEHGPLFRNAPGCDGQGTCPMGCPTGAKRSSDVSWVPRALRAGATCFTGMTVRRLLKRGNRVVAIEATGQDPFGARKTLILKGAITVISAGTLESPLLLQRSGIQLPRLGKGLSIHPALGNFAFFEKSLGAPWNAIPQSYEIRGLGNDKISFEGFYVPPGLAAGSLDLDPTTLSRWMSNVDHVGQFGFMTKDENRGRVSQGLNGRPLIHYSLTKETQKHFALGSAILAELMLVGGASEVATGIKGIGMIHTLTEAREIAHKKIKASDYRPMGFHPLGTCAMGKNAKVGVVDFDHRVHGMQNLYVVDGSSVPTSLGVNPQVTIMAMALRASEIIANRL